MTVPEEQVEAIRRLLDDGVAGWGAMLAAASDATGGPLTDAERTRAADSVLDRTRWGRVSGAPLDAGGLRDVVDAHVVRRARRAGSAIVTTDPADLHRLDPQARLVVL